MSSERLNPAAPAGLAPRLDEDVRARVRAELARRLGVELEDIRLDEPLARHCSFRVGGPAELYFAPRTSEQIRAVPALCRELGIELTVLGLGTNLIISDHGLPGLVLQIDQRFAGIACLEREQLAEEPTLGPELGGQIAEAFAGEAQSFLLVRAGTALRQVAHVAERERLTGLEFASGIPGTVGGAIYMNAGAYGYAMKDVLILSQAIDPASAATRTVIGEAHAFGYRDSRYRRSDDMIVDALFRLRHGEPQRIREQMEDFANRRRLTQPLEFPSAGSIFKRPPGHYAGKLIMDAGLQGCRFGGAEVSHKHAGFIINVGGATAADIMALIRHIQDSVLRIFGVQLETEVRFLGQEG